MRLRINRRPVQRAARRPSRNINVVSQRCRSRILILSVRGLRNRNFGGRERLSSEQDSKSETAPEVYGIIAAAINQISDRGSFPSPAAAAKVRPRKKERSTMND